MPQDALPGLINPVGQDPRSIALSVRSVIDYLRQQATSTGTDLTALQTSITNLEAAVTNLEGQEDKTLTPQQVFELSLITATAAVLGSAAQIVQDSFDEAQRTAEASLREQVRLTTDTANIRTTQAVSVSAQEVTASAVTVLQADLQTAQAAIVAEQTARADGDTALASSISTVSTTVGSNTTSISNIQTSVNGVSARWGVSVSAQNQVIGLVQLDGSTAGSAFTVVADKFVVASPSDSGITQTVFQAGLIDGVPSVGINGSLVVDGTILARNIAANAITADKIQTTTLSAIAANLGTVTVGKIESTDGRFLIDATNKRIRIVSA